MLRSIKRNTDSESDVKCLYVAYVHVMLCFHVLMQLFAWLDPRNKLRFGGECKIML